MPHLLRTPGYFGHPFPPSLTAPLSVRLDAEAPDFIPAGSSVQIKWAQDAIGEVSWCELALAFGPADHGDPSPAVAGWATIAADLQTQALDTVATVVVTERDIPAGAALYVIVAGQFGQTMPGIGGANAVDPLGVGEVAVYTGSAPYQPSLLVGQPVTFAASKTVCPIRASVLLP